MIVPVITAPIIATAVFVALFNKTIDTSLSAIDHMQMPNETEKLSETLKILRESNTIIKDLLHVEIEEICESQTNLRNQLRYGKLQRGLLKEVEKVGGAILKEAEKIGEKVVHTVYEEGIKVAAAEIEKAVIEPVVDAVKDGTRAVVETVKEGAKVVVDTVKEVVKQDVEIAKKVVEFVKEAAKKAYKAVTKAVSSVWKTVSGWFHWRSTRQITYLRESLRGLSLTVELLNLWEHVIIPHDPTNNTIDYTGHDNLNLTHANDKLKLYLNSLRTEVGTNQTLGNNTLTLLPKVSQNANEAEDKIEKSRNKEKLIKLFDTLNTNFIL